MPCERSHYTALLEKENIILGYETQCRRKDGSFIWVSLNTRVIRDDEGKALYYEGFIQDITESKLIKEKLVEEIAERKRAEEKMISHDNFLRSIIDYSKELLRRPYDELFTNAINVIKELFRIKAAWICTYDEKTSELVVEYSSLSDEENSGAVKLLGKKILGFRAHVDDKQYRRMTTNVIELIPSLHELTFGAIPDFIGTLIEKLVDTIISLYPGNKGITLEKCIEDFSLNSSSLFPLGLVINELITNAMKYAFAGRDKGILNVTLMRGDKRVALVVQDDGIGSVPESDQKASAGFGLTLVNMIAKQLKGSFHIENSKGTKCIFEFSI